MRDLKKVAGDLREGQGGVATEGELRKALSILQDTLTEMAGVGDEFGDGTKEVTEELGKMSERLEDLLDEWIYTGNPR